MVAKWLFSLGLMFAGAVTMADEVSTMAREALATTATAGRAAEQMIKRLEEQHFYLQRLDNVRQAMERELSIAKIMRECEALAITCTGDGLINLPPPPSAPAPAKPEAKLHRQPNKPLPSVQGIVGNSAWIMDGEQQLRVRRGSRVDDLLVREVALDHVVFERAGRRFTVPLRWLSPQLKDKHEEQR